MGRRACLTAIACLAVALLGAATASAGGHGGKIYFADQGPHLDSFIFSVSPNGRHRDRLTKAANTESDSPAVSPNGRKIAFDRFRFRPGSFEGAIWTMRADGSHQKRLTPKHGNADSPSFSPDGRRIVYERHFDIIVMDANGRNRERLTGGHKFDTDPVFSPDGEQDRLRARERDLADALRRDEAAAPRARRDGIPITRRTAGGSPSRSPRTGRATRSG